MGKQYEIVGLDEGHADERNAAVIEYYPVPTPRVAKVDTFETDLDAEIWFDEALGRCSHGRDAKVPVFTTVGTVLITARIFVDDNGVLTRRALVRER